MAEENLTAAQMLKHLRDATGLGLMECKDALEKANGDASVALISLVGTDEARMIRIVKDKNSPTWVLEALVSLNNRQVLLELTKSQNAKKLTTSDAIAIANKYFAQKNESDQKASNDKNAREVQKASNEKNEREVQNKIKSLEQEVQQIKKAYNDLLKTLEKRDKEILEAINKNGSRSTTTRTTYSYFPFGDFGS